MQIIRTEVIITSKASNFKVLEVILFFLDKIICPRSYNNHYEREIKRSEIILRFHKALLLFGSKVHKMFHCAESKVGRTMGGGELPKQQTKTYCYFYWHNRFFAPKSPEAASTAPP
jgi:hypothetical protein